MREFKSFGAFAVFLGRLSVDSTALTGEVAEEIGKVVEARAKGEIGHYQPGGGGFEPWAPLTQATELRKVAMDYPINSPLLGSGEMRDSISHTVVRRMLGATVVVGSTDEKMIYHEVGTSKMPPRPVIGPAMFHAKEDIEKIARDALLALLIGKWKKGAQRGSIQGLSDTGTA